MYSNNLTRDDFVQFVEDLNNHPWPHTTNTYRDYIQATKAEDRLFGRAMMFGLHGMDSFRRAKEDSIRNLIGQAVHQAIDNERAKGREALAVQKAAYDAVLTNEQKELMAFREELKRLDWWYDYIEDGKLWRSHDEAYKKALKEARLRGPAFEQMWVNVYKEKIGERAQDWTFEQHFTNSGLR
jgi:hypothetical protein